MTGQYISAGIHFGQRIPKLEQSKKAERRVGRPCGAGAAFRIRFRHGWRAAETTMDDPAR